MGEIIGTWPENDYRNYFIHSDEDMKYGLPEKKKYPMPDRDHVMSAIKFFNYVSPSDEKELARNIVARIKEYGITGINVGEKNRFGKYYKPEQYLQHHGIQGQKWGVRNAEWYPIAAYQAHLKNRAIKRIKTNAPTKKDVDEIISTLSVKEKELLGMHIDDVEYLTVDQCEYIIHREIQKVGEVPVSFFDMLDDGNTINLAMATRKEKEYRGKGYASKAASQAMDWLDKHPKERKNRDVIWGVRVDNAASIAVAKKLGFEEDPDSLSDDGKWINYVNKVR